jgi:hypothetical protein
MYCECFEIRKPKDACMDIWDELKEFIEDPSRDELSDIGFGINRLIGGLFNRKYIAILPNKLHIWKIEKRMNAYGCIRSERKAIAH